MKKLFIYKTTCLKTGKFYIGQHYGYENDSYLGSGLTLKNHINKYGIENFKREILEYAEDRVDLDILEAKYISFKTIKNKKCLNRTIGGGYIINYGKYKKVFQLLSKETKKHLNELNFYFKIRNTRLASSFYSNEELLLKKSNVDVFESFLYKTFEINAKLYRFNDLAGEYLIPYEAIPEKYLNEFYYFIKEILHDFNTSHLANK
jgi:hypothetical protein